MFFRAVSQKLAMGGLGCPKGERKGGELEKGSLEERRIWRKLKKWVFGGKIEVWLKRWKKKRGKNVVLRG